MTVPDAIKSEVVRQQELMGWPEYVPHYAIWPHADGHTYIKPHFELTVGDCEQLVEFYSRKTITAIRTWRRTGTTNALRRAGKAILYARLYRCRYIQLTGQENTTEADMPLPLF